MIDTSDDGVHVHLDGTYVEHPNAMKNDHPVWIKPKGYGVRELFMFLQINQTQEGDDDVWRWIIMDASMNLYAECLSDDHPNHPAACNSSWHVFGESAVTLTTDDDRCPASGEHICLESTPPHHVEGSEYVYNLNGIYRQIHSGVHTWVKHPITDSDAYITVHKMNHTSFDVDNEYAFVLVEGKDDVRAYCTVGEDGETVTDAMKMKPWECNEWIVFAEDPRSSRWQWIQDEMMDVDLCDDDEGEIVPDVTYDELLCFLPSDYDGSYSHYQGMFGLYELTETDRDLFGGRPFYNQPRLDDVSDGKWHIIWFDEHDSWVMNDFIPNGMAGDEGHVFYYESWCTHTNKPNNCSTNWPLYQGYEDIESEDSTMELYAVTEGSTAEVNCMAEPTDTIVPTDSITLCFDDSVLDPDENPLSGDYVVADDTYNGRYAWVKDEGEDTEKWLFYDSPKRFWVIDDSLGDKSAFTSPDFEAYCLQWDELEPFNCGTWYFYNSTADDMPRPGEHDERVTKTWSMSVDTCDPISSAMSAGDGDDSKNGATSAGAIIGYVIAALVFILCVVLIFFVWKPCEGDKGKFSFRRESSASELAKHQIGGVTASGMDSVEMETSPRSTDGLETGTAGNVVRPDSGSISYADGDVETQ